MSPNRNESMLYFAAGVVVTLAVSKLAEKRKAKGGVMDRESGTYPARVERLATGIIN